MTAVVESKRLTGFDGDLKIIAIITDANCASGHTIDCNLDGTANVEKLFSTAIVSTSLQNTTGTNVADCTWDNTTGVITIPTISTGVHKVIIRGY